MKQTILNIIFLFITSYLYSQDFKIIKGIVNDFDDNRILEFVNIYDKNKQYATSSDINGRFLIKLPLKTKIIYVSHIGYNTKKIKINRYKDSINVKLRKSIKKIEEVIVNPKAVTLFIDVAKSKIVENYSNRAIKMRAWFNEKITENDTCIEEIDALLDIYKNSYSNRRRDQIQILRAKKNDSVKKTQIWDYITFINGPYEMIKSDIAKYPKKFIVVALSNLNFLKKRHYKHFNYKLSIIKNKNGENEYLILFKPKSKRAVYKGEIYIDAKSMAFKKMKYSYDNERLEKVNSIISSTELDLNSSGMYTQNLMFNSIVNFKKIKGLWYLDNVRAIYSFNFIHTYYDYKSKITVYDNLRVINISSKNVKPIRLRNQLIRSMPLHKQLGSNKVNYIKMRGAIK